MSGSEISFGIRRKPLEKARVHAMLCYRTPESLNSRFNREIDSEKQILKSHDWLNFHEIN
jgi:homoserine O-acetyltransferase